MATLIESDVAVLNCSFERAIVRVNYRGVDAEPVDGSAFEMAYNESCQPEFSYQNPLGAIINRKLAPAIMLLTMCTNILICIVLTRKNMISSTNVILLGMAIADMLTGVFPLPIFIASIGTPKTTTIASCMEFFVQYMPTSWHAASVWLTVLLAVQRFIFITFPTRVKTLCTVRHSVIFTILIFVFSLLFNGTLLSVDYMTVTVGCLDSSDSLTTPSTRPLTSPSPAVQWGDARVYRCYWSLVLKVHRLYMLARLALMHILPCVTLTIFTTLLIVGMHNAVRNRRRLLNSSSSSSRGDRDSHSKDANATSRMLIVVLIIFLVVEVPNGIAVTLQYLMGLYEPYLIEALNFAIVVSYPVNFFVYCGMSRQFRGTFRDLLGLSSSTSAQANRTTVMAAEKSKVIRGDDDHLENSIQPSASDHNIGNNGTVVVRPIGADRSKLYIPLTSRASNSEEEGQAEPKASPTGQTLPQETYDEEDDEVEKNVDSQLPTVIRHTKRDVEETALDGESDPRAALISQAPS